MTVDDPLFDQVLQTKLYPPRVPGRLVRREHLIDRLGRDQDRHLVLVSAPPGYGKSLTVLQWLQDTGEPYAWLSVDEQDDRLDTFLIYLVAAINTAVSGAWSKNTLNLLLRSRLPAPAKVADAFLQDVQALPVTLRLVIDDYHALTDMAIHQFMSRVLQLCPPNLCLLLITRADPPLTLSRLRGLGQVLEIRGVDLRFSVQEAAALLDDIVGEPVDPQFAAAVVDRSEGWPVGLRLAAMSLRSTADPQTFLQDYVAGSQRLVTEYLLNEVLDRLPNEQRLLLLRTAVVDRFCAPLVDVLTEQSLPGSTGQAFLEAMWGGNFFLIALDDQGTWYRYHHLFRQLLEQQLWQVFSPAAVRAMHAAASAWFENNDYIEDAILHAIKAGNAAAAARIVEAHANPCIDQENWRLLEKWKSLLPATVRRRPALLAIEALLNQIRYSISEMSALLNEAEEGLRSGQHDYTPTQQIAWQGLINTLRASSFLPRYGTAEAARFAELALQQVDPASRYVYSMAEFWQLYNMAQAGRTAEALTLAQAQLRMLRGTFDVRTGRFMLLRCGIYFTEAQVSNLLRAAEAYDLMTARAGYRLGQSWAHFMLGWATYQANRLEEAEEQFMQVIADKYHANLRPLIDSVTGLVLISRARGDFERAHRAVQELRNFLVDQELPGLLIIADSLALRLEPQLAAQGLDGGQVAVIDLQLATDLWELPVLTRCSIAIAARDTQRLPEVGRTLEACRAFALSRNNKRELLQIGALQALWHEAQSEREAALIVLQETVQMGEPGGALRYFVDLGPALVPLLQELLAREVAVAYVQRILAAYPQTAVPAGADGDGRLRADELTNREMDVLVLLEQRLTNKEIAARLHVSPRTVKKHTINLYQKLGVENRRQAVVRAQSLGILPAADTQSP